MSSPRRILLIHLGQLGDAVMALPAAQALRARFPKAALTVLTGRGADGIYRLAGFDTVWTLDRVAWKRSWLRALAEFPGLLWRLRRARFDLSVDLHSFKETNWLAFLAGIPERVAMLRPTRSVPSLINRKPPPDDPHGRLLERYLQVLVPLGIHVAAAQQVPRLTPPAPPPGFEDGRPILGLCPGAGHPSRRWPADRFAAVARVYAEKAGVVVFAGPEESAEILDPLRAVPGVRVVSGLSIAALAGALARCRVVLTNPTGPSHIAAAVGSRVLTLGEVPAFDPVPIPPGAVIALRGKVAAITLADVLAALAALWAE